MNKLPKLLGIVGNIGAGKNEVAKWFNQRADYTIRGYSDPIYEQMAILNPWISNQGTSPWRAARYNDIVAEYGVEHAKRMYPEVRQYLRLLGTECGRDIFGHDCWLRVMDERRSDDRATIIQGVRFPNEVDHIQGNGGEIIWVSSPRETPPDPSHYSEVAIRPSEVADWGVYNNTTIQDLHNRLELTFGDLL